MICCWLYINALCCQRVLQEAHLIKKIRGDTLIKKYILLFTLILMLFAGCDIFDNKKKSDLEWKKTPIPSSLKSEWYHNSIFEMKITSTNATINNQIWSILRYETNGEEYRMTVIDYPQYRVFYFRNLKENSVEKSMGEIAYSEYNAQEASRSSWIFLEKNE